MRPGRPRFPRSRAAGDIGRTPTRSPPTARGAVPGHGGSPMKKMLVVAPMAFVLLALTIVAAGSSADSGKVRAQPGTFDPDKTKTVVADWKPGVGLPDAGGSNHGLVLEKN